MEQTECPYCHRPYAPRTPSIPPPAESGDAEEQQLPLAVAPTKPSYVDPTYFQLLEKSPATPGTTSPPATPSPSYEKAPSVTPDSPGTPQEETNGKSGSGISAAAFSPNYFERFFVTKGELGKGGKGVVLLVQHILDNVSLGLFACKRVPVGDNHEWLKKVLIEVQLLQNLSHQNIVSYQHVWLENVKISAFSPRVPCAFILQQYCNSGDLHKYIHGNSARPSMSTVQQLKQYLRRASRTSLNDHHTPRKLSIEEIYSFFRDITSGLRFLHARGYIHRDLKPSNCLLHRAGNELRVLVSDFGEVQYEKTMRRSSGTTGTISYCAPEVLRRMSPGGPFGNFSFKSDIFSLGMILHFLCFATLPYQNADVINEENEDVDLLRDEISGWTGFPSVRRERKDLPEQLYTLLELLLSPDPEKRPNAEEVLQGLKVISKAVMGEPSFDLRSGQTHNNSPKDMSSLALSTTSLTRNRSYPESHSSDFNSRRASTASRFYPESHPPDFNNRRASTASSTTLARNSGITSPRSSRQHKWANPSSRAADSTLSLNSTVIGEKSDKTAIVRRPSLQPALPSPSRRLLLPPSVLSNRFMANYDHRTLGRGILGLVFALKVHSLLEPCSPNAVNPWFMYPLLLLAVVDFTTADVKIHFAAFVLHVLMQTAAVRTKTLCLAPYGR